MDLLSITLSGSATGRSRVTLEGLQVGQLGPHRLLGRRTHGRVNPCVYPGHDLVNTAVARRASGPDLVQPLLRVTSVEGQPSGRVADAGTLARKQLGDVLLP